MSFLIHKSDEPAAAARAPRVWRMAGWGVLVVVLALAFFGYLTPDMRVQWANFVALCGF